ncbi:hypothetical protein FE374_17975 [Georgenia yuyongxinii]|uniref:Uncharacterized protein n=1 Tax=Georgenia yuyongxinii TaxID=2589797 RepID=A0A5B8C722_9MICO|nr:hypothetical protein [Georgenia yuyongxinii]QDC26244.1 hypothetical protein FE374_17975 [Georgenia yuyongxinii]
MNESWPGEISPARTQVLAAISTMALAQAELRAAFPVQWRGAGAEAYATALTALLHHAQEVMAGLRQADAVVALADRQRAAALAGGAGP